MPKICRRRLPAHPQRSPLGTSPSRFAALSPPERRRRWAVSRATWLCAVATAVGVLAAISATTAFGSSGGSTAGTSWYGFSGGGGSRASAFLSSPAGRFVGRDGRASIAAKPKPRRISAAAAFVLPSATKCVSGHALTLQVRKLAHVTWIGATVKVNGKRSKTIKRSQVTRPIELTGLPTGKFVLAITATTSNGRSVTAKRTYTPCATKTVKPPAGSYSGHTSQSSGLSFYVSADSTQVQDITIGPQYYELDLGCTPGGSYQDTSFSIPAIVIASDGSFTGTATTTGVVDNSPAKLTYTFSGHFNGTSVAGQVRDDITYNNGTAYSCTSNNLSWSATRDTQGSQTASPPPAGSYSGHTSQSSGLSFYVSADSTQFRTSPSGPSTTSWTSGARPGEVTKIQALASRR